MSRADSSFGVSRPSFSASTRTINISSPAKPEIRNKMQAQDLRLLLKDKIAEFGTLDSEWKSMDSELNSKCEDLIAQLRDLDTELKAAKNEDRTRHLAAYNELIEQHKAAVLDLQTQIDDGLSGNEELADFEEIDAEITELKEEITRLENAPAPTAEMEVIDQDAEDRIRTLEDRLEEMQQVLDEALRQREEDSKASTQMIEQLVLKNQEAEEAHQDEIQQLIEELNNLDRDHAARVEEIEHEIVDEKRQIAGALKSSAAKANQLQTNISKKQRDHNRELKSLQETADQLRNQLEAMTARQKQQMKEASLAAKKYGEEKRKFVSMHRELEMLNAELVRETVEHETLMKELNKMDNFVLSQMSSSSSTRGPSNSFSMRSSKF